MTPYFETKYIKLYHGDCRSMSDIPNSSVHCVVTSPPYWGLREYDGLPDSIFGGKADCEHEWNEKIPKTNSHHTGEKNPGKEGYSKDNGAWSKDAGRPCSNCGAWRGKYGLEPTVDLYIYHTLEVLAEIWRVLRSDGVVFWNIGDSYASGKGTCFNPGGGTETFDGIKNKKTAGAYPLDRGNISTLKAQGLKPKDMCLIPFRVALAAQAAGWYVRSDIIWNKSNPMPESVKDRPTNTYEHIFLFTKSARYYWDAEAIREDGGNGWHSGKFDTRRKLVVYPDTSRAQREEPDGRNCRDVWTFPTQGYSAEGKHYATFPEELPLRCIKAGTSEYGVCAKCGAPWERIVETNLPQMPISKGAPIYSRDSKNSCLNVSHGENYKPETHTIGWQPTCKCEAEVVPATVLDPFAGSGTTLLVATRLGRRAIGYELSPTYCELVVERNKQLTL